MAEAAPRKPRVKRFREWISIALGAGLIAFAATVLLRQGLPTGATDAQATGFIPKRSTNSTSGREARTRAKEDKERPTTEKELQQELQTFYVANSIDDPKKTGYSSGGGKNPLMRFWIDRLFSTDPIKRDEATKVFESAFNREAPVPQEVEDLKGEIVAISKINRIAKDSVDARAAQNGSKLAAPGEDPAVPNFPSVYDSDPYTPRLIPVFVARLDSADTAPDALRVLNGMTYGLYGKKDAEWWKNGYPNSKLAAVYAGANPFTIPDDSEE